MTNSFSPSRPFHVDDVKQWDIETDVAIVGFGAAGTCAAIEARNAGAAVDVFEVAAAAGGSAALSGGEVYVGGCGGTSVQKAAGFVDTTEDFFQYLMMAGGPGADQERACLYAENAEAHFRWLAEQGIPYKGTYLPGKWLEPHTDDTLVWSGSEQAWPFSDSARPAPRGHAAQLEGWGAGKIMMERLAGQAQSLGAIVHYNSRALTLIVGRGNRVVGLIVRINGTPQYVRARHGVILSAGGFIVNHRMVEQYAPQALACTGSVSAGNDDGSGIRMGISVGGAAVHMDQFFTTMPYFPPESLNKGIFVNERGARFINEDAYHGRVAHYVLRQPGGRAWLLVDAQTFARPTIHRGIHIAAVGESWDEVEQELALPPGSLQRTVEEFNRLATEGRDPYFHKAAEWLSPLVQPPFAALSYCSKELPFHGFTLGGLSTTTDGAVLDADGHIIPGIYAAGRSACGLPRWGEGYSSGMSLGDSTYFGRRAGCHAAMQGELER